jgi:hypothetical protein
MSAAVTAQQESTTHPAVRAWLRLHPRARRPGLIEVLKPHRTLDGSDWERRVRQHKWSVFRLHGMLSGQRAVVAKYCSRATAEVEQLIYERVIPEIGVSAADLLGVSVEDEDARWLFLSDEGDMRWSPNDRDQRRLFTDWVATMHERSAGHPAIAQLPDRGADHYFRLLRIARERMSSAKLPGLRAAIDALAALEARWSAVTEQSRALPETLVHGDLVPKNIRLRSGEVFRAIVPLDWETAGVGSPAADLAHEWFLESPECRSTYRQGVRSLAPGLSDADLTGVIRAGMAFRSVAAMAWQTEYLELQWKIEKSVANLLAYASELAV